MNGRPFDLVIFDLDGTLVDSAPDIAWSLNATLVEAGLPALPVEAVIGLVGDGASQLIDRALAAAGSNLPRGSLLAGFLEHYANHLNVGSRLYPGISGLLDILARSGVTMAVLTNKPHFLAQELLTSLAIAHRFVTVIGDGDGFPRKPDPTAALSIMGRTNVPSARTIVVGDGLPDIGLARAIPCPVLSVTWGYVAPALLRSESPTFVADTVDEATRVLLPQRRAGRPDGDEPGI